MHAVTTAVTAAGRMTCLAGVRMTAGANLKTATAATDHVSPTREPALADAVATATSTSAPYVA